MEIREKLIKKGWDRAFKEKGKIFVRPEKDIPKMLDFSKKPE